jgi:hypothetical protein
MKPPMLHTAYKYTYTRDKYGDYVATTSNAIPCHFRYIVEQNTDTNNETTQSDATAWFDGSENINKKDILLIDNEGFRVERVTKARRLRNTTVLFLKCDLQRYGIIS